MDSFDDSRNFPAKVICRFLAIYRLPRRSPTEVLIQESSSRQRVVTGIIELRQHGLAPSSRLHGCLPLQAYQLLSAESLLPANLMTEADF